MPVRFENSSYICFIPFNPHRVKLLLKKTSLLKSWKKGSTTSVQHYFLFFTNYHIVSFITTLRANKLSLYIINFNIKAPRCE